MAACSSSSGIERGLIEATLVLEQTKEDEITPSLILHKYKTAHNEDSEASEKPTRFKISPEP